MDRISSLVAQINAASIKTPDKQYRSLDALIDYEYDMARKFLIDEKGQRIEPTWTVVTKSGQVAVLATPFVGEGAKDVVAIGMKIFLREVKATRYAFVSEAWLATVSDRKEWERNPRPPSEREDRVEVVLVTAGDRKEGSKMRAYEIVRDWNDGSILDLKLREETEGEAKSAEGRFVNMLEEEDA